MIIIWRYLLTSYLKVFLLAVSGCITLLMVSRLQEIARFITLGTHYTTVFLFIAYQIPYILPIAAALASLLAAFSLFHRLSTTQELTTLRFSGLSLGAIAAPLLLLAALLSFGNFYLNSECATTSHLKTRKMIYDLTSSNPLLLLSHTELPKLQSSYLHFTPLPKEKKAKDLVIAQYHKKTNRIHYLLADQVDFSHPEFLIADNVAFIGTLPGKGMMIENEEKVVTPSLKWNDLLRSKGLRLSHDYLTLKLLRLQKRAWKRDPAFHKKVQKCDSEILRRVSLTLCPLTFTFMGIALGIHIGRNHSKKKMFLCSVLGLGTLLSFFIGKEFSEHFYLAALFFLLPHVVIFGISWITLHRMKRGAV